MAVKHTLPELTVDQARALRRQMDGVSDGGVHYTFVPQVEMTDESAHLRAGDVSTFTLSPEHSTLTSHNAADNYLIEADNLPALIGYVASGAAKADVIYIDPPYNRMKDDLTYADSKRGEVLATGGDPHAPWVSFMLPRLVMARDALRDTGVIIAHIGKDEDARLGMLLDRVFGRRNKVTRISWQGGEHKATARFFSHETDYMHVYAKNLDALSAVAPEAREHADSTYDGAITDIKQTAGTKELQAMLGRRPNGKAWFDYPKPTGLLSWVIPQLVPAARVAESVSDPIRVLDFFGGSGSTGHAVLDLDAREGENWRFTLITINEGGDTDPEAGIARSATSKRLRAAVTGEWAKPTKQTRAYNANVHHVVHGFTEPTHADGEFPWGDIARDKYVAEYRRLLDLVVEQGDFVRDIRPATNEEVPGIAGLQYQVLSSTVAATTDAAVKASENRLRAARNLVEDAAYRLKKAADEASKRPSAKADAAVEKAKADVEAAVEKQPAAVARAEKAHLKVMTNAVEAMEALRAMEPPRG